MQNTGTSITGNIQGFRKIGNFTREQVELVAKRACQSIGKSWDHLREPEKQLYLTTGANALANQPTILTQAVDVPDLQNAKLPEFQHAFLLEMRKQPGWSDATYFNGLAVDLGAAGGVSGDRSSEATQSTR